MDNWTEHVLLEIADAFGDSNRLLEITQAILGMYHADLIPDEISDKLFDRIDRFNQGG